MDSIETPDYEFLRKSLLQMAQDSSTAGPMDLSGMPNLDISNTFSWFIKKYKIINR